MIHLRWSIALLASAILAGAGVVLLTAGLHDRSSATVRDLADRARQVQSRLSGFDAEAAQVQAGLAAYERLLAQRIIGPENRHEWLEQIDRIRTARRLLALRYEFQPQTTGNKDLAGDDGGGYKVMVSTMTLQLDLLHENDLMGLLADLRMSVGAWLLTRECRIDRLPEVAGGTDGSQALLRAGCVVDWVTLREAS